MGTPPPNGGVECRWGRQKTQISGCIGHVYWCFYRVTLTGVFLGHFRISLLTHICLQLLLVVSHCSLLYLIVVYCIQYFCAAPLSNTVKGTLQIPLIDWLIDWLSDFLTYCLSVCQGELYILWPSTGVYHCDPRAAATPAADARGRFPLLRPHNHGQWHMHQP